MMEDDYKRGIMDAAEIARRYDEAVGTTLTQSILALLSAPIDEVDGRKQAEWEKRSRAAHSWSRPDFDATKETATHPLSHKCPYCDAEPGEVCLRDNGKIRPYMHSMRWWPTKIPKKNRDYRKAHDLYLEIAREARRALRAKKAST